MKILRFILICFVAISIYFGTGWWMIEVSDNKQALLPNMSYEEVDNLLPGLSEQWLLPIMENEILVLNQNPVVANDVVYLPVQFVIDYFDDNFYWDPIDKVLTYTTVNEVIRMRTADLTYYVNDEPLRLNIPILELVEGIPFMPLSLVEKFSHHKFYPNLDLGTLVIEDLSLDSQYSLVEPIDREYGIIRTWKDSHSTIVTTLGEGDQVEVYDDSDLWYYVRTQSGLFGYIKKKDLGDKYIQAGSPRVMEVYDYSTRPTFTGGLNLAWHQVTNTTANNTLDDKIAEAHSLNVISPTWFHLSDDVGHITNIADINYVRKAHKAGLQVWALFSNQFDAVLTHEALSTTSKREMLIKELLALSALYEIDGINVDFENVAKDDGEYFVQFIKELTPFLKAQNLVVSVDMYVPSAWTAHYGRQEVGEVVDYVMIMAYDEHWSTSPDSGSVASIGFVEKGITDTLASVPADKTVLGLPYYTRIWVEEMVDGNLKVSSKAYGMESGFDRMDEKGVTFLWDEDVAQYYGDYEEDGITYKMWLEEERSIEEKLKLMQTYELAGVAGWKIGLEKPEIWDILSDYLLK